MNVILTVGFFQTILLGFLLGIAGGAIGQTPSLTRDHQKKGIRLRQKETGLDWSFPISRCQEGIPMGNGRMGALVWGQKDSLFVTVAQAGFWDRRFTRNLDSLPSFTQIKEALLAGNRDKVESLFRIQGKSRLHVPRQLGGGLFAIPLPRDWQLKQATLFPESGKVSVKISRNGFPDAQIDLRCHWSANLLEIEFPIWAIQSKKAGLWPQSAFLPTEFRSLGIPAARIWSRNTHRLQVLGMDQKLPSDSGLGMACAWSGNHVWIRTGLGSAGREEALVAAFETQTRRDWKKETDSAWESYIASCPKIRIPDPVLDNLYRMGRYKMAICTHPAGPALTLQGPLMEHHLFAPWSNDYHFNVNVQMAYQPFLASGQFDRMAPLIAMVRSWMPAMKKGGKAFFGREDALLLPHACTDKGEAFGGFWSGLLDPGSLAWLTQLLDQYALYTGDESMRRDLVLPLAKGCLAAYQSMMDSSGIPVSVSPEYRGTRMDAWGKNASFQLAAIHALVRICREASPPEALAELSPVLKMGESLPLYTSIQGPFTLEYPERSVPRIALWDSLDLPESHRHHSHLAGIYPFRTFNPLDSQHREIVHYSLLHWANKGFGAWAGWSVPWAAHLLSRNQQSSSAVSLLRWGAGVFFTDGLAPLHDGRYPYQTASGTPAFGSKPKVEPRVKKADKMQLEAGFGYMESLHDILVQQRDNGLFVLPAIPEQWKDFEFDGIHTECGLVVGATVRNHRITEIRLRSKRKVQVKLHTGMEKIWLGGKTLKMPVLDLKLGKDEIQVLRSF